VLLTSKNLVLPVRLVSCSPSVGPSSSSIKNSINDSRSRVEHQIFLARIDQAVPAELDVPVICDNSSTTRHPPSTAGCFRIRASTCTSTPTYSSWLNLVQRWFAELTTKWLKRGTHRSVPQLKRSIQP